MAALSQPATAVTIDIFGELKANTYDFAALVATLDCNDGVAVACNGFIGGAPSINPHNGAPLTPTAAGTASASTAARYDLDNANAATEAAALNVLTGGATSFADGTHLGLADLGGCSDGLCTFTTMAEYFALKLGRFTTFFQNLAGGEITVTYDKVEGRAGAGLSHVTEFGGGEQMPIIPLPMPLPLFLAALAGIGLLGRRRHG